MRKKVYANKLVEYSIDVNTMVELTVSLEIPNLEK